MFLALAAVPIHATPIRPDVQRLLAAPAAPGQFVPARAGWHGPETPMPVHGLNGQLDRASSARAVRASLVAAAIPDPWAVLAIAAAILLLRWLRLKGGRQQLRRELPEQELPDIQRAA
jgi:hypothetical protein